MDFELKPLPKRRKIMNDEEEERRSEPQQSLVFCAAVLSRAKCAFALLLQIDTLRKENNALV